MQVLWRHRLGFISPLPYGWIIPIVITVGLVSDPAANASTPSFRCGPNVNEIEHAICTDDHLAAFDVELNAIYTNMMADATPADRKALMGEQRKWLSSRGTACPRKNPWFDATARIDCLGKLYDARIDELIAQRSRLGLPNDQSALRPGDTVVVGDAAMHCGTDAVRLGFREPVPGPYDTDDERAKQMPISTSRGLLDAAFADCRLSDGTSIRVKTGQTSQAMPYGMCGGAGTSQLSVWIDHRKVISSLDFAFCMGGALDTLSITKAKADFCLLPGVDFKDFESSESPAVYKNMKLTHGHCGVIAFAATSAPDAREFSADGKPLLEPGTLSLEASAPMRAMCERLLPKEGADDPVVPDDMSHPEWKETKIKLPQPHFEGLLYNATTLPKREDADNATTDSATFDLENTGKSATVYILDNSGSGFDGTALATDRKDILVTPFDVDDQKASLAKGIHVWAEDHASVFFDHGKTYILLDPVNHAYDPKVIALHGKLQETVCTFHRAQENF